MEILTKEVASLIVKETVKRTKHNISIMDSRGEIISSFDKERIGTIHEGAQLTLKKEAMITLTINDSKNMRGTQPGINLPIIFQDKIVGVIGITGNPEQLTHIADLVKMSTELLLYQNYFTYELEGKIRSQELFIEELLKSEPSKSFIKYLSRQLSINLLSLKKCITINIEKQIFSRNSIVRVLTKKVDPKSFTIGFTNSNRIVILITDENPDILDEKINKIHEVFINLNLTIFMSTSLVFKSLNDFKKAYEECELVFMLNEQDQSLVSFEDVEEKTLLYQIDDEIRQRFKKRVLNNLDAETLETLKIFFHHDLNITQTAKYLYIHRNTLLYRLKKCENITGLNPKKYSDALKLQIAMWC
jgi:carbohydrate diacid regulator